jgi:hypothetical protein
MNYAVRDGLRWHDVHTKFRLMDSGVQKFLRGDTCTETQTHTHTHTQSLKLGNSNYCMSHLR